jgi:hypothetical protein
VATYRRVERPVGDVPNADRFEDAAVLFGATESARAGFPPFGSDAATLREAKERMCSALGDAALRQCADKGSILREDEVVRFALDALNRAARIREGEHGVQRT